MSPLVAVPVIRFGAILQERKPEECRGIERGAPPEPLFGMPHAAGVSNRSEGIAQAFRHFSLPATLDQPRVGMDSFRDCRRISVEDTSSFQRRS
jgi:hypothetical protein